MSDFLFFFGRTPKLAFIELLTYFPDTKLLREDLGTVAKQEFEEKGLTPGEWIQKLGGVVKIATVSASVTSVTPESVAAVIAGEPRSRRLTFGVSTGEGEQPVTRAFLEETKLVLESEGHHVRFIESRHGSVLSSVVIAKNDCIDITIVKDQKTFLLARTEAVQDFESWNMRDYGRPYADPKSGMLPPKVARMVVNIGMPNDKCQMINEKPILLDPFSGMGTIVAEGALAGWKAIGSDQSQETVGKAKKNLEWLDTQMGSHPSSWEFFVSDATHISEHLKPESVDAVVTEPYMGHVIGGNDKLKNVIKGLEKLYIGCLKDWHSVLKPGGRVVIALPEYRIEDKMFFVKKVIDRCENLGYTKVHGPIEYSRPQAVVRRKFFVLQKILIST